METKDTQIEGLEEIARRNGFGGSADLYCLKTFLADPAILAHIPAVKALQEENERLSGLSKEHFNKLNEWQAAYIKAERTLLLAGFADEGGELWKPPLGPSASPLLDRIATLEAQLAGGEAVGIFELDKDYFTQGGEKVRFVAFANAGKPYETVEDEQGRHRYTQPDYLVGRLTGTAHDFSDPGNVRVNFAAPAIKQQVAEDVADKSAAKHFNCDDSQLHVCHECDGYGVHP